MASIQRSIFYLLNASAICVIFVHNSNRALVVLVLLQRYVRKGVDEKNPAILRFFLVTERTHLRKSFVGNTPISREPLIRVSRIWAQKYLKNKDQDY